MKVWCQHGPNSIAAFAHVGAQVTQKVIRVAMAPLDVLRATHIWLSFWGLPVAFYALYRRLAAKRPHAALLGLAASLSFVACELSYRTIDLFVVTRRWSARAERVALWDEIVEGWYVLLLAAHVAYAVPALEPVCAALYFPTAVASFAAVGAVLWVATTRAAAGHR